MEQSFLDIQPLSIWVLAMKHAEDTPDATVIRIQERSGKPNTATLISQRPGLHQSISLKRWEIKTFFLRKSPGSSLLEEVFALELPK
jgi:hypothetical protein